MSQTRVMHAILNQPQDCAAGHGALGTFEILPYYYYISFRSNYVTSISTICHHLQLRIRSGMVEHTFFSMRKFLEFLFDFCCRSYLVSWMRPKIWQDIVNLPFLYTIREGKFEFQRYFIPAVFRRGCCYVRSASIWLKMRNIQQNSRQASLRIQTTLF